jgi:hypothetical protein
VALRADTARHFITGATVLIFSAAAIGTAMRYQDSAPAWDLQLAAELPAREAPAAAHNNPSGPMGYRDGAPGSGADIAAKLDGTVALSGGAGALSSREARQSANAGSARWWADTSTRMTATSGRSGNGGSVSLPGSGYSVSGGARGNGGRSAQAPRGPGNSRGNGNGGGRGSGGGGGGSSAAPPEPPVFGEHTPTVGELVGGGPVTLDPVSGNPGGGLDPGDLAHSPEPASLLLMATGAAGVLAAARRRRRRQ